MRKNNSTWPLFYTQYRSTMYRMYLKIKILSKRNRIVIAYRLEFQHFEIPNSFCKISIFRFKLIEY